MYIYIYSASKAALTLHGVHEKISRQVTFINHIFLPDPQRNLDGQHLKLPFGMFDLLHFL